MSNNNNRKKQHNKGFSLFTVLIAVSFVVSPVFSR